MRKSIVYFLCASCALQATAQKKNVSPAASPTPAVSLDQFLKPVKWRNIGPYRGGRSVTATGITGNPLVYYMGTTGGGVWKTEDAGASWFNISDGFFNTGSVGAVAVSESDPNVVYVGMGEHAPRGVMTSYGDGVYKSLDGGKTWTKLGLDLTRHIANIVIHPQNPDIVWVAAQGALHGPNEERGVYKSIDGGKTWKKTLYVDANSGCADLVIDRNNARVLYAALWDHRRLPWQVVSGGNGSGLYKSVDGGETWTTIHKGLPKELGKIGVSVSGANSNKVYALVESDTQKEQGGLFVSEDAGANWTRVSKDHRLTQRAWYYVEVFADPNQENTVYVLNSPGLKSTDGGRTWTNLRGTHGDYHQLWINPKNSQNMIIANDGGGAVTFNGGKTWSAQNNQPTAQFYRVNADNLFPYNIYGGQQDNTSVKISSRNPGGFAITERDWWPSAGGESAFMAFNPDNPRYVMGGSYQGTIEVLDVQSGEGKPIMVAPIQYQALQPKEMKYRFNWNAPIVKSPHDSTTFYHAGNILFKTTDMGRNWVAISPDLTRHDTTKMGISGAPYTNEGAGGENYCTIAYVVESPQEAGTIWTGSDDGLVHLTRDGGKTWNNVTPPSLGEALVNSIEVSPHDKGTVYIAATRYKFNDFTPILFKTTDYGKTWSRINNGIPNGAFTRVVREDDQRKGLLYCGTETGFYISYDSGASWQKLQLNLPIVPITDLKVHRGDLIASTSGRAFWILDDLAPLRSATVNKENNTVVLYQPEDGLRVSGGSVLDRADGEDEGGLPRPTIAGANPTSGVALYYQLPQGFPADSTLKLEILDAQGKTVRTYSSKKDSSFVSFPGGPSPDPQLSARSGLNRFVWDMRYATLPGVPNVFIEGSYQGRKAAPGTYTVRLTAGNTTKTASFKVLPDPRINATDAEYAQQQQTLEKVENGVREIHGSVLQMRKVKKQIADWNNLLKEQPNTDAITSLGKSIISKIDKWEEELVQNKSQSNDDVINYVNKLSADYIFLRGELDANIPYVTRGQLERIAELDAQWQQYKKQMQTIVQTEVLKYNQLIREASVPAVAVPGKAF